MNVMNFLELSVTGGVINTLVLIGVVLCVRYVVDRYVRRRTASDMRAQRRWINTVRNIAVAFVLVGLLFIWSPQLSSFALSLTAVALAIVIAIKEILLNLSGAVLRMATNPFEVGDWIEIDGLRGEVTSENMFAVKLEELDSGAGLSRFTGRTVTIPNSRFLTSVVIDEGNYRQFVFHRFVLHVEPSLAGFSRRDDIRNVADRHTEPFREEADRILATAQKKSHVELPSSSSLIRIGTTEIGKTAIQITIFCPTGRTIELEQTIARDVAALFSDDSVSESEAEPVDHRERR